MLRAVPATMKHRWINWRRAHLDERLLWILDFIARQITKLKEQFGTISVGNAPHGFELVIPLGLTTARAQTVISDLSEMDTPTKKRFRHNRMEAVVENAVEHNRNQQRLPPF